MAWIRTIEGGEDVQGTLKTVYNRIRQRMGMVPNIYKVFSLRPTAMQATFDLFQSLMYGPGGLSQTQREMIAMVVSAINRCHYWMQHHGEALHRLTKDKTLAKQIAEDFRRAALDAKTLALLEYAEQITVNSVSSTQADIDRLREKGLSDDEIFQAAAIAGCTNYMNRIAHTLGVELESPGQK